MIQLHLETNRDIVFFWSVYLQQWWMIDVYDETPTHHVVPYIGDLAILLTSEINTLLKKEYADQLIQNNENELFNLPAEVFRQQVITGQIEYCVPRTTLEKVNSTLFDLVLLFKIFVKDYHHQLRNKPVLGVW